MKGESRVPNVRARLNRDGTAVRLGRGRQNKMRPRADLARIDATSDAELVRHAADDERAAQADAGAYARGIRRRLNLSQAAFAQRIGVSVETVRNWEQGKRSPDQAAKALRRIVERTPEAAFRALSR